ncbi:MAG TPA: cbb3-type cytochrome c oxidase subunit I, partial [Bacteroidales bacterium]|nr:cbb3-type cytochrome c oxidase subunit I [Bacteroidales bacterium]
MTEERTHHPEPSYLVNTGKHKGLMAWLTSTDHKRIGLMYMYAMMVFFSVGVLLGVLMRLELLFPGQQFYGPQAYNGIFTIHGIIMIFTVVIPGLAAVFGNFAMPIMIGAKDVAFPRLNLLSFYLYVAGAAIALTSQFIGNGPPDTGWTFYAPYSIQTHTNVVAAVFGAFVLGFSSILTGLNFIVTIHRLRAPGMTFFKMPLFPWSLYATAWIQVLATPIVGITLLMIIAERWLRI